MPFSNFKFGQYGIKTFGIGLAIILANVFLFVSIFSARGTLGFTLSITSFVFVDVVTVLFLRSIYLCSHEHEELGLLTKNLATVRSNLNIAERKGVSALLSLSEKLRTPLQAIRGYSSMLLEGTLGTIQNEAKEAVEKIFQTSVKLTEVAEELIEHSNFAQSNKDRPTNSIPAEPQDRSTIYKIWIVRSLLICILLVLLLLFILAPSLPSLLGEVFATIVFIFMGLFLSNDMNNEPGLLDTINNLRSDIDMTTRQLNELEQDKERFTTRLSSEIYVPLIAIMDSALHISQGAFEELSNEARSAASKIFESSERLAATVSELSDALK